MAKPGVTTIQISKEVTDHLKDLGKKREKPTTRSSINFSRSVKTNEPDQRRPRNTRNTCEPDKTNRGLTST